MKLIVNEDKRLFRVHGEQFEYYDDEKAKIHIAMAEARGFMVLHIMMRAALDFNGIGSR